MCEVCRGSAKISTRPPAVFGSVLGPVLYASLMYCGQRSLVRETLETDSRVYSGKCRACRSDGKPIRPSPRMHGSSTEADMTLSGPALHTAWTPRRHGDYAGLTALINGSQGDSDKHVPRLMHSLYMADRALFLGMKPHVLASASPTPSPYQAEDTDLSLLMTSHHHKTSTPTHRLKKGACNMITRPLLLSSAEAGKSSKGGNGESDQDCPKCDHRPHYTSLGDTKGATAHDALHELLIGLDRRLEVLGLGGGRLSYTWGVRNRVPPLLGSAPSVDAMRVDVGPSERGVGHKREVRALASATSGSTTSVCHHPQGGWVRTAQKSCVHVADV
jgi:hypothetical protein